jgi:ABC-type lipoprotein export system ATPase subunit
VTGQAPTLLLHNVVRGFDTPAGRLTALKGVSFEVQPGELVVLVGKSGSGKSVLLNLLAGLDRPSSGALEVAGARLDALSDSALTAWRRRCVGTLLQGQRLFDSLNVLQNVQLALELAGNGLPRERAEKARERLAQVGMLNYAQTRAADLSEGQRRRVTLAQALANDPPLMLADEPTLSLDSVRAAAVFHLFRSLVENGKTVVMGTRDYEMATHASRTLVLSDGEVVSQHVAEALPALDLVQLNAAAERLKPRRYAPGQVVVRQGERADRFFIITRGEAEILIERPDAEPVHVNTLGPGQYFGEIALVRGGRRTATVRASASLGLDVLALGKDVFWPHARSIGADARGHRPRDSRARAVRPGGGLVWEWTPKFVEGR